MATKKFLIEVEEGETHCDYCVIESEGHCPRAKFNKLGIDCDYYNLATMKIIEMEEEK